MLAVQFQLLSLMSPVNRQRKKSKNISSVYGLDKQIMVLRKINMT